MKRFVLLSLLFLSPVMFFVLLAVPSFIYEWRAFEESMYVPNKSMAVIGDSLLQYAVNDSHIPYAENFALRASSPNFWKAISRMAFERNPQIKYALIGINPNVVLENVEKQRGLSLSRGHTPAILMLDVMRSQDMGGSFQTERLIQRIWGGCICPAIKRLLKINTTITLHEGWFSVDKYAKSEVSSWPKAQNGRKFPSVDGSTGCQEIETVIELAEHYGVVPVLVTAPIPRFYLSAYTKEQEGYLSRNVEAIVRRHNCRWLDYRNHNDDLDDFCDFFHLNTRGAIKFSKMLDKDLREYYPGIQSTVR